MNNFVVLGDCATDGSNTLAYEVMHDKDIRLSFSLLYHRKYKEIIQWYMKCRAEGKITTPINMRFLQSEAINALDKEEIKIAWPALLNAYNYSSHGNTFQGYHYDLKNHIEKHGKPNLVAIADFAADHVYVRLKHRNESYCGNVVQNWIGKPYKGTESYSENIYNKKQKHGAHQYTKDQTWLDRKSRIAYYCLIKYLEARDIQYFLINYRNNSMSNLFDKSKTLDLSTNFNKYNHKINGDLSYKKYNYQTVHAKQVKEYIDKYN